MATFHPGQLVRLRSGGPVMVVGSYEDQPLGLTGWACYWTIQGAVRREVLPEAVLIPVEGEAETPPEARTGPPSPLRVVEAPPKP
jgi:uncharacterized protein YodC (DUF2158 family)